MNSSLRILVFAQLLCLLFPSYAFGFSPPSPKERLNAIGPIEGLPLKMSRALDPKQFEPIRSPGPNDWLDCNYEPGQTFKQFRASPYNEPDVIRKKIYLQPLGQYEKSNGPPVEKLRQFVNAFFGLEAEVLPVLNIDDENIQTRTQDGVKQLLTVDLIHALKKRLKPDAFLTIGITMDDLYPGEDWNYVFGDTSPQDNVSITSFARFDPHFWQEAKPGWQRLLLRRSCLTVAFCLCASFGIDYCIFYRCAMNGSNNLPEEDSLPLHLCPIDLRKLQSVLGFDIDTRYHRLKEFYKNVGLDEEANWIDKRIQFIER